MLFKRRNQPGIFERLRVFLWPRRSWARSLRYVLRRIWRLNGTPRSIAVGCAAGVFISFTPFLGIHFILAGLLAWSLGGNIIASALGTFAGNPITFPFIWISTFNLGAWFLGDGEALSQTDLQEKLSRMFDDLFSSSYDGFGAAWTTLWPMIKPMAVGAAPLGLIASLTAYFLVRKAVESYRGPDEDKNAPTNSGAATSS